MADSMNNRLRIALVAITAAASTTSVAGDRYPSRPITIVVPTTAGGPPDTIARLICERMKVTLGEPIIVENVTGAGGRIWVARREGGGPGPYRGSSADIH